MRNVLCADCAAEFPRELDPQYEAAGFQMRRVEIAQVKKPAGLHITIDGEAQPELETIRCDGCGGSIPDGQPVTAISMWRGGGLGPWEKEYSQ